MSEGWVYGPVTVLGTLYSKSNRRKPGKRYVGKGFMQKLVPTFRKSDEALQYVDDFYRQVRRPPTTFTGPVRLVASVFYKDMRPDLDISLLQDCIQNIGILKNDRQIVQLDVKRYGSKKRPRVIFSLVEVPPVVFED